MSEVFVQVGEDTRRVGRSSPEKLLDDLEREKKQLVIEKQRIEFELTKKEDERREKISKILGKRLDKTTSIRRTNEVEMEANAAKYPLIREKLAIEQRLHDIKSRFSRTAREKHQKEPREDVVILLRIELLLQQILEKVDSQRAG